MSVQNGLGVQSGIIPTIDPTTGALINPLENRLLLKNRLGGLILVGDSISMYSYQPRKSAATLQFGTACVLVEFHPDTPTGAATVEYVASTKMARFKAFGGTFGEYKALRSGFNTLTSGEGYTILFGCRYSQLETTDQTFTITCASTSNAGKSARGAANWSCALAGQRIYIQANHGIGGDRITDVVARLDQIIYGDRYGVKYENTPRAALLLIGANTILGTAVTLDEMENDYTTIVDTLLAGKIEPLICTLSARSSAAQSATPMSAEQTATFHEFNRRIRALATSRGLDVVDYLGRTRDPASAYLMPLTGFTADYLHPTPLGGWAMAKALTPVLMSKFPPMPRAILGPGDNNNHYVNPSFLGTGGTAGTGVTSTVVPDSWTAARVAGSGMTCVLTRVAATDGGLDWVQMACTGATADSEVSLNATTAVVASDYGLVPGVTFYAEIDVDVDASSVNLYSADLRVSITDAAGLYKECAMARDAVASRYWPTEATGILTLRTREITIPADLTSTGIKIEPVVMLANGGSATVRYRDLQVVIV